MSERNQNGIDYIELPCENTAQLKAFYGEAFGWSFVDYGDAYCSFNDGRMDGGFLAGAPSVEGGALIVLYAEDLEGAQVEVESAGGTVVAPIFSFPGGRRFEFTDPAGNRLAVWSDR